MKNKQAYVWGFVNQFLPQGIYLAANIILARFLSPQEFGMVGVLSIFITLSTTFVDSGLCGGLIKEQKITYIDCGTVFTFNLSVSLILYGIIALVSPLIESFYNISGLCRLCRILSLVFVINALSVVPQSILMKQLAFNKLAIISICSTLIASVVALIGCLLEWGVYSLVAFQLTRSIVKIIFIYIITKYKVIICFSKASFKKLFSFGFFTTISSTIDSIYENILSIFFGKFLSIKAVGYYDQAKKLETGTCYGIVGTINMVSFPVLSKFNNDLKQFTAEASSIQHTCIVGVIPLLALIGIFSNEIILLLYGEEWLNSATYLSILVFNGIIYLAESLLRNNIKALGYVKILAGRTFIKRIIGIGVISLFLILFGSYYMLYGLLVSTFIGFLINAHLYCKLIDLGLFHYLLTMAKDLISPIILITILLLIKQYYTSLTSTLCTSALVITLYYFIVLVGRIKVLLK